MRFLITLWPVIIPNISQNFKIQTNYKAIDFIGSKDKPFYYKLIKLLLIGKVIIKNQETPRKINRLQLFIMKDNLTLAQRVLKEQFTKNQNPEGFKIVIRQVMKGVEDRAYWYFTADEAEFLSNVYTKEVEEEVLRRRLKQITDDAMNQLLNQFISGNITKVALQHDQLVTTIKVLQKVQAIAQQGHQYYAADHPVARQSQQKIKEINQSQKAFKARIEYIKQKQRQKKLQKQSIERQIQQKIAEQKKLEYHKQVMKRLEIMKLKQEQRIQQNQKFKSFLKQFKKSKPLHVLMEEEYKQKIELPNIQESRKKLEIYKHKKKPTLEEINDHERSYMTAKQSKPQKNFVQHKTIDVGYKSHFYQKIQEEEREGNEDSYNSSIWDQLQKKKRYSLMVKQNYKPRTSRVLQSSSIDQSRKNNSQRKISSDLSRVKEIGKFYLQYVKNLQKKKVHSQQKQEEQEQYKTSRTRYANYLQELKRNNQGKFKGLGSDWEIDLKDRAASKSEKRDRIMMKSKQLQQKAMREQVFIKNFNYGKPQELIGRKRQIDQTLLQSIKAKMALLKQVKQN